MKDVLIVHEDHERSNPKLPMNVKSLYSVRTSLPMLLQQQSGSALDHSNPRLLLIQGVNNKTENQQNPDGCSNRTTIINGIVLNVID